MLSRNYNSLFSHSSCCDQPRFIVAMENNNTNQQIPLVYPTAVVIVFDLEGFHKWN